MARQDYPRNMTNTEKCRNADESPCGGEVFERWSRSGMTSTVRCDVHQRAHDEILDGIANRYPDTSVAPDWFDESYAGERWDSDY